MASSLNLTHAQELAAAVRFLHGRSWAPATSSNYSIREVGQSDFFISQSGVDKGSFEEKHLVPVDAHGAPINDTRRPSAETLLHCLIYRRRPEVHCVLHTHTVVNTALSYAEAERGKIVLAGFELNKALPGISTHESVVKIPVFANSQDIGTLAEEIGRYWDLHPDMQGFLLAGHGLYTWGVSVAEAKRHVEVLEFLFETLLTLRRYGFPYIPPLNAIA